MRCERNTKMHLRQEWLSSSFSSSAIAIVVVVVLLLWFCDQQQPSLSHGPISCCIRIPPSVALHLFKLTSQEGRRGDHRSQQQKKVAFLPRSLKLIVEFIVEFSTWKREWSDFSNFLPQLLWLMVMDQRWSDQMIVKSSIARKCHKSANQFLYSLFAAADAAFA